ncbi:MAG TPA: D-alanyl-D-alanine carboxypeptidase/D-alanyl-D-alanine-endopeptidase [Burkholderiaceae bacterium]|nr:D-alanyl-D-alanine carboxypeptidase/D-alanyl-D-alanine-endopeptidase [Burkholderiaceae bacterium]
MSLAWACFVSGDVVAKSVRARSVATSGMPGPVAGAIGASGLPLKSFGFYAQEVGGSERTLAALNAETPYMMASTTKVVTSLAALDLLGPYYRWRTSAYAMGPIVRGRLLGDLLIVGGGNAQLTSAELQAWFTRMREQGLEDIQGDIVLDRFAFNLSDEDHAHTPAQSASQPRHVWPAALTLDEGRLGITVAAARGARRAALSLTPELSEVTLVNQVAPGAGCAVSARWDESADGLDGVARIVVRGSWSAACGTRTVEFIPPPHSGYAARALPAMWAKAGGILRGRVVASDRPLGDKALPTGADGEALQPLSFQRSKPLPELVRDINKTSDNMAARNLMLSLSPGFPERAATLAGAQKIMRMWLRDQGIADGDIEVENGSGLSHSERAKPRALVQLLRQGWHADQSEAFLESLPVAGVDGTLANRLVGGKAQGRAFLKTGTLNDTRALAGYVRALSGRLYAVSAVVNHADAAAGRPALDAFIEWVARNG